MTQRTHEELILILENLAEKVDEGFEGVHKRQDLTNGNVKENTQFRIESEAQFRVWRWILGVVGISNVGLIIKALL